MAMTLRWMTLATATGVVLASPVPADSLEERLEASARGLGSARFEERERASRELQRIAATAPVPAAFWLRKRWGESKDLEVRSRLARVLDVVGIERWRPLPPAPIRPRTSYAVAHTRHAIFVWGGNAGRHPQREAVADGALFDPLSWRWKKVAASPLAARCEARTWVQDDRILVWGGNSGAWAQPDWRDHADGAWYDPARDAWERFAGPDAGYAFQPVGLWTGKRMLVCVDRFVGRVWQGWLQEPAGGWKALPHWPFSMNRPHGWMDRHMFVWGDRILMCEQAYDTTTGTWKPLPAPVGKDPRGSSRVVFWTGSRLIAATDGGGSLATLDPAAEAWQALPPSPLSRRAGSMHLLDQRRLLLFGEYEAAVLRLDPPSWTVLPRPPSRAQGLASRVGRVGEDVLFLSPFLDGRHNLRIDPERPIWKPLLPPGLGGTRHHRPFVTPRGVFYWGGVDHRSGIHEDGAWLELAGGTPAPPQVPRQRQEDE